MTDLAVTPIEQAAQWTALAPGAGRLPLQQSWGYGAALAAQGAQVHRFALALDGRPVALVQLAQRRVLRAIQLSLILRGPLWLTDDLHARAAAVRGLSRGYCKWRWRPLIWLPDDDRDDPNASAPYRTAGLRPVMSGYATIWVDLAPDEAALRARLKGKWRNALGQAERAGLEAMASGAKPKHWAWLLDREEAQREQAGYLAPPTDLVGLYAAAKTGETQPVLVMTAHAGREKLAGQLFLLHGRSATYHLGWTGAAGRKANAHTLLLWHAMLALKARGVRWLDLGGLDTGARAGIARFKLGVGVPPVVFSGAWV